MPTQSPTVGQVLVDQCGALVGSGLYSIFNFCDGISAVNAGGGQVNIGLNGTALNGVSGFNTSVCTAISSCVNQTAPVCTTPSFQARITPGLTMTTTESLVTWNAVLFDNFPSIISHNGLNRIFIMTPGAYKICYFFNIATGNTGVDDDVFLTISLREDSLTGTVVATTDTYPWGGPINGVNVRIQDEGGKCRFVTTVTANKTYVLTTDLSGVTGAITFDSQDESTVSVEAIEEVCVARAGNNGAPGAINIQDEGGFLSGGPFLTLDFVGEPVTVTNAGVNTATVTLSRQPRGRLEFAQSGAVPTPALVTTTVVLTQHIWAFAAMPSLALSSATDTSTFSEPTNGRVQYTGPLRYYYVSASLGWTSQTSARIMQIAIYKNGVIENGSIVNTQMPVAGVYDQSSSVYLFNITSGDYFETWIRDTTSGDDAVLASQSIDFW